MNDGASALRRTMVARATQAIYELATTVTHEAPLDDLVMLVADEHDPAARLVLDPLGLPRPGPRESGEQAVLLQPVLRQLVVSIVARFDADMAARLRAPRAGALTILVIAAGGANTAYLRLPSAGEA